MCKLMKNLVYSTSGTAFLSMVYIDREIVNSYNTDYQMINYYKQED